MTHVELLAALHIWLHREGGDIDLAGACARFDWSQLPRLKLTSAEERALEALDAWYHGASVDLIDAGEDFHETFSGEACRLMDETVVRLDGRVACGYGDVYEADNVIPLVRLKT